MCRSISHDEPDEDAVDASNDPLLDNIVMNLTVPRHLFDPFRIVEGDVVHIIPFCTLVTNHRELKAIHAVSDLPNNVQNILFGSPYATHPGQLPNVTFPRNREEFEATLENQADIRSSVDHGCLAYVDALPADKCDDSQRRALLTTLGECGEMLPNSSSLSMIIGPLVAANLTRSLCSAWLPCTILASVNVTLMHLTRQFSRMQRKKLRFSDNVDGCRVLVTCSSNYGADQVAMKLAEALPMADGSLIHPLVVRIGRTDYEYKGLEPIALHTLALQYDIQVYNIPDEGAPRRRWASTQALRALMNECVIIVCTNATASGPMLQNLNVAVSAVLIDEAGHSSEMETLMQIMANVALAQEGRVHILIGDPKQLEPVFLCHHDAVKFVSQNRWFRTGFGMLRQFESIMESFFRTRRCKVSWLTHHYRSHPCMARVTTRCIYSDFLSFPAPDHEFDAPYNNVPGDRGLQTITTIDTRLSKASWESGNSVDNGSGRDMYNNFEFFRVNEMLYLIYKNRGSEYLTDKIIVCAPYADQTAMLQARLRGGSIFMSNRGPGSHLNVAIDNIDALQGSEREISNVSLTRSNRNRNVGFLTDDGRLNVAFTRARKLLAIIGDFSTTNHSTVAHAIYDTVRCGSPRTRLEFHRPDSRRDFYTYQENVMNRI